MSDADRMIAMETRSAEQERTIEELSGQIAAQWREIERMRATLDALAERFVSLEEQGAPAAEAGRPPHW